jgi:hypothetical protein
MRIRVATLVLCSAPLLVAPVHAQYGTTLSNRAIGETYHVEVGGFLWYPTPDIVIRSEGLGLIGTEIDLVDDLQMEEHWMTQLRVVLRPATKHKFRFEYTPIKYENPEAVLNRDLIFNGIRFPVSIPLDAELVWRAYRFGYEWDFVYKDRGFAGVLLDLKYTDVEATLRNVLDTEFVRARAPIPAIGFIGRGYVLPNVSITGEFSFFRLPEVDEDYGGGFRSFDVFYKIEDDEGSLKLKGLYFGGLVRF